MRPRLAQQVEEAFGGSAPDLPGLRALLDAVEASYEAHERQSARWAAMEQELRQAEKLRAVGQLAFGIAHEINTPIQFAGDSVHFLRGAFLEMVEMTQRGRELCRALEAGADPRPALATYQAALAEADPDYLLDEIPKAIEQTLEGLKRVAQIVLAMKEFGRPDQREKVLADVNRCVSSTLTVAHNEIKYTADVQVELGELSPVLCYPGELGQVVLNLLINAAHAISDRYGTEARGRIVVRTAEESDGVLISISDNGCGIPEAAQGRIFEPFFTTKELGRGTGQGLSLSRSIVVDRHGGTLTFESRAGAGSTFYVRLPAAERPTLTGSSHEASAHG